MIKPRIKCVAASFWKSEDSRGWGIGFSPAEAYSNWALTVKPFELLTEWVSVMVKPRIKKLTPCVYTCKCGRFSAIGTSPKDAYENWMSKFNQLKPFDWGRVRNFNPWA